MFTLHPGVHDHCKCTPEFQAVENFFSCRKFFLRFLYPLNIYGCDCTSFSEHNTIATILAAIVAEVVMLVTQPVLTTYATSNKSFSCGTSEQMVESKHSKCSKHWGRFNIHAVWAWDCLSFFSGSLRRIPTIAYLFIFGQAGRVVGVVLVVDACYHD